MYISYTHTCILKLNMLHVHVHYNLLDVQSKYPEAVSEWQRRFAARPGIQRYLVNAEPVLFPSVAAVKPKSRRKQSSRGGSPKS